MKDEREKWIDGLRGIACIIVFVHHFYLTFGSICFGINELIKIRPFGIIANGNYSVCLFLTISAYLQGTQIYKSNDIEKTRMIIFKRYFRLAFPVFFSSFFSYLISLGGGYFNHEVASILGNKWLDGKYSFPLTITDLFLTSFVKVWWMGDASFNAPFWMLKTLFFGTFLSILVALVTDIDKKYSMVTFLALIGIYFLTGGYNLCFILGVFLAWLKYRVKLWNFLVTKICKLLAIFIFGLGIFMPEFYKLYLKERLASNNGFIGSEIFYNIIGSFFILFGVMGIQRVKNIMAKSKILQEGGRISFAIYLVHWPIICSLSCWLYIQLSKTIIDKNRLISIIFVVTLIVVCMLARIFNKVIERKICNKLMTNICNKYFNTSKINF